jgi:hypothetical protein
MKEKYKVCFTCKEPMPIYTLRKEYCCKRCAEIGNKIKAYSFHKELRDLK